jgi:vacuolar protein-sorting-associated protein 4
MKIKDEKNPTSKEIITKRVEGYMTRAEQLREMLEKNAPPKPISNSGTAELEKYDIRF